MPACDAQVALSKLITFVPDNAARDLPAIQGDVSQLRQVIHVCIILLIPLLFCLLVRFWRLLERISAGMPPARSPLW